MDHKRNLLLAALAVVSYLMLLAWNQDFPTQAAPTDPGLRSTAETASLDLPVAVPAAGNDVPATAGAAVQTAPLSPLARIVTVRTPAQIAQIDLLGGDIIALSLPRYPTTLETPNDPFRLLQNDALETYIAQSGLVGRDGPDGNSSGRPMYQSAQSSYAIDSGELTVDLVTTTISNVRITKRFIFTDSGRQYTRKVARDGSVHYTQTGCKYCYLMLGKHEYLDPHF